MKKHLLFLFTALLPLLASAQTKVVIDGIWYNLDEDTKQAEVTYEGRGEYSGSITIPAMVTYEGVSYSVTSIGEDAFGECFSLTTVTIPEGVTSIAEYAFYSSSLTGIIIPEGVTSIGEEAFAFCEDLTAINIPASAASIGSGLLHRCINLATITVVAGNTVYDSRGECNAIIETNSNTLMFGCSTTVIPEGVTGIGNYAFEDCWNLTAITIPASVTSIGEGAFEDCLFTSDKFVNNSTCSDDENWGATLYEKEVDGVFINENAAVCCRPSVITAIIPEGVTSIGEKAFQFCFSLETVILPESVTSIGKDAFRECWSLTTVNIPEGVTSIEWGAFGYCEALKTIIIPKNVTSIGEYAFRCCTSLTDIYCYAETVPEIEENTFMETAIENITLHVPANALGAYKAADIWNSFASIVVITNEETSIEQSIINNGQSAVIYDLMGRRVEKAEKGLYIVNGKKMVIK